MTSANNRGMQNSHPAGTPSGQGAGTPVGPVVETGAVMEDAPATGGRFPVGTFEPAPKQASFVRMLLAQTKIESLLFLRHGEQQLLSLIIPVGLLLGLALVPVVPLDDPVARAFPMVLAVAIMGAGFTGQAIAVAFDRRYGALKRIGAAGVPTSALIAGKIAAVLIVVAIQVLILTVVALLLGWSPPGLGLVIAVIFLILGVGCFTSLGLLLGGTLSSEMVLALANTIWFVLLGAVGYSTVASDLGPQAQTLLQLIPSVALAAGLEESFAGGVDWFAIVVLAVWAIVGAVAARKLFSFTIKGD
ncbi:ABC transporter permease [Corynebacterium sp. UMB9976]|uniref:ABC transporter permease n=1 Tax=Corynebacterium sp. UMB9976 TaxID=3046354 RepID=UPI00254BEC36|nr:ABC transporter permease [Corynebacterium sp. UMB9976]MDK6301076.1 ABC transporter permease [Corynebacterium sp. UMB9976]